MKIFQDKNTKLFQRDPVPQISRILRNKNSVKVVFADNTTSTVSGVTGNIQYAILQAIAMRAYSDKYELADPDYNGTEFLKNFKEVCDAIEYWSDFTSVSKDQKRTSKIASILNGIETNRDVPYSRPMKAFSSFTQDEKRAYWREAYRRRKQK